MTACEQHRSNTHLELFLFGRSADQGWLKCERKHPNVSRTDMRDTQPDWPSAHHISVENWPQSTRVPLKRRRERSRLSLSEQNIEFISQRGSLTFHLVTLLPDFSPERSECENPVSKVLSGPTTPTWYSLLVILGLRVRLRALQVYFWSLHQAKRCNLSSQKSINDGDGVDQLLWITFGQLLQLQRKLILFCRKCHWVASTHCTGKHDW